MRAAQRRGGENLAFRARYTAPRRASTAVLLADRSVDLSRRHLVQLLDDAMRARLRARIHRQERRPQAVDYCHGLAWACLLRVRTARRATSEAAAR